MRKISKFLSLFLITILFICGCAQGDLNTNENPASTNVANVDESDESKDNESSGIKEDGSYTSKDDVADYIVEFGHLPSNFITKKEAKNLGWVPKEGNLNEVAPGKSIGGDRFNNYEKTLPTGDDIRYTECDIDYNGGKRGSKRIVFDRDNVYYTEDHYKTFTKIR